MIETDIYWTSGIWDQERIVVLTSTKLYA